MSLAGRVAAAAVARARRGTTTTTAPTTVTVNNATATFLTSSRFRVTTTTNPTGGKIGNGSGRIRANPHPRRGLHAAAASASSSAFDESFRRSSIVVLSPVASSPRRCPVGALRHPTTSINGGASTTTAIVTRYLSSGKKKNDDDGGGVGGRGRHKVNLNAPPPATDEDIIIRVPPDAEYPPPGGLPEPDADDILAEKFLKRYRPHSGLRRRPLRVAYSLEDFERELSGEFHWTSRHKRCGAIGLKLGMMPVWDDWGVRHPCTVLHLDSNVVLRVKSSDGRDGYDAVVLGAGEYKKKNVTKPLMGQYEKYGVAEHPPYLVREFRISRVDDDDGDDDVGLGDGDDEGGDAAAAGAKTKKIRVAPEPGTRIHARHFLAGQNVDIAGISKGKGFQGAMKRHNFAGMPATHGTSRSHRSLGSTGQCQDPGKVFKGKKMAGRMGAERVTVQNLRVIKIDRGRDLLYVRGHVPGNRGTFVEIRDAVKRPLFGTDLCEPYDYGGGGGERGDIPPLPTFEYDENIDGCGEGGHEVMKPLEQRDPELPLDEAA